MRDDRNDVGEEGEKSPVAHGLDENDMDVLRNANPDMLNQTVGMASHEDLD